MLREHFTIGTADKLATAIGMEDELCRWLTLLQSHAQSGDDEPSIEDLMHGPTDHAAGKDIQDGNKIQPALAGENAGRVGRPHLVRPFDHETFKAVRRNWPAVTTVGCSHPILGTLTCKETFGAHETGDAIASSRASQHLSQSWATIGLTNSNKFLSNALAQAHVLF